MQKEPKKRKTPDEWFALWDKKREKYFNSFTKGNPDECWVWQKKLNRPNGYGVLGNTNSQRLGYYYANGRYDLKMFVCHRCDNPPCQNPNHLFLGTPDDNMKDKTRKGRHKGARGEAGGNARLTNEQVLAIRSMYETGKFFHRELAVMFNVTRVHILRIVNRTRWQYI